MSQWPPPDAQQRADWIRQAILLHVTMNGGKGGAGGPGGIGGAGGHGDGPRMIDILLATNPPFRLYDSPRKSSKPPSRLYGSPRKSSYPNPRWLLIVVLCAIRGSPFVKGENGKKGYTK
ncbi:hypothetical protein R3P38DRAFT_2769598 [Favolaschia claudopus]|uniref:Uncharacterized protein n=1 Tax=Favolaschia claudopus TaxID=2862362 RepID=A0AAW0CKG2_9AGAR